MRVLHLNTERTWRGGERQTFWLAETLSRRGHESRLACRPEGPLAAKAKERGLAVFPLSPSFEFDLFAARRIRRHLLETGTDILHAHTGHAVGLGAMAVRGTDVKLVVTRRVDFPLKVDVFSRWKYGRAHAVACISGWVRKMVLDGGVPEGKTVVIPSGIDPTGYPLEADRDRLRRERGVDLKEVVLVHVGALVPHKDQAVLLRAVERAAREVRRFRLILLGDGPLRKTLEQLARDLGIADRTVFMGNISDVLAYTALADLFVFSSKEEGLGTALLDALAVGVPTAATAAGGIPDIYGGPDAPELSPPGDPEALARNILSVLNDPEEARRRAERGRQRIAHFTVEAMADGYEVLYRKVLSQ